jgi:hypothetical protein
MRLSSLFVGVDETGFFQYRVIFVFSSYRMVYPCGHSISGISNFYFRMVLEIRQSLNRRKHRRVLLEREISRQALPHFVPYAMNSIEWTLCRLAFESADPCLKSSNFGLTNTRSERHVQSGLRLLSLTIVFLCMFPSLPARIIFDPGWQRE